MKSPPATFLCLFGFALSMLCASAEPQDGSAAFEGEMDVGNPGKKGGIIRQQVPSPGSLTISGGGENMWFTNDAFHFVWRRMEGDFDLRATISWLKKGGNGHRKACLIARESLTPDSAYVDLALHGDGLLSLQFREETGGPTREIQAGQGEFSQLCLRRQGSVFSLKCAKTNQKCGPSGAFMRVPLKSRLYVGLAVCAHDNSALEQADFSDVNWRSAQQLSEQTNQPLRGILHSSLETISIASHDRRVVYHTTNLIEAPNWTRDGSNLVFNGSGRLHRIPARGGEPIVIDTGTAVRCNNDHGFSPDGARLAISDSSKGGKSLIYIVPAAGGTPALITMKGPSYWHGWSPDGSILAYCAERDGEFDVYSIRIGAGQETRLTSAPGLDDGPEYTADGKFIYFNSERSGSMQIWRMKPDGSNQEQVTNDELNNWFPHPSPDGKWLVFLSYEKGIKGHPANQPVKLRLLSLAGGLIQELTHLFGGQGTINVASWSPGSRELAFVSYETLSE